MHIQLPYGNETVPIDVPDNWINGRNYRPHELKLATDPHAELVSALSSLPENLALNELLKDKGTLAIAIDTESPCLFQHLLGPLIEIIEDSSELQAGDITIILTNRLVEPFSPAIVEQLMDADTRTRCRVILHDPLNSGAVIDIGESTLGVPLTVNRAWADADARIILGTVRPDLIMGFTGGRAVLMPGLAGKKTLKAMYAFDHVASPHVRYGNFRDNPFHLTGIEAATAAKCDLAISVITNLKGEISRIVPGQFGQSHWMAMNTLLDSMRVKVKEPMDIVVTSGGGAPHDNTLAGLVATLSAVMPVLKPDGTIVVAAALEGGLGPAGFADVLENNTSVQETLDYLNASKRFTPGKWIAQRLYTILKEHEVILFNKTWDENAIWSYGMTPTRDTNEAIHGAMESHGQRCKIVALPDGPHGIGEVGR